MLFYQGETKSTRNSNRKLFFRFFFERGGSLDHQLCLSPICGKARFAIGCGLLQGACHRRLIRGFCSRVFSFCIVSSTTRRLCVRRLLCCRAGPHVENFFFVALLPLFIYFSIFSSLRVRRRKGFVFWFYEDTTGTNSK